MSYSVQDLVKMLDVAQSTVYYWMETGQLKPHLYFGCRMIDADELVNFFNLHPKYARILYINANPEYNSYNALAGSFYNEHYLELTILDDIL